MLTVHSWIVSACMCVCVCFHHEELSPHQRKVLMLASKAWEKKKTLISPLHVSLTRLGLARRGWDLESLWEDLICTPPLSPSCERAVFSGESRQKGYGWEEEQRKWRMAGCKEEILVDAVCYCDYQICNFPIREQDLNAAWSQQKHFCKLQMHTICTLLM